MFANVQMAHGSAAALWYGQFDVRTTKKKEQAFACSSLASCQPYLTSKISIGRVAYVVKKKMERRAGDSNPIRLAADPQLVR